jgi:hypothetical protein
MEGNDNTYKNQFMTKVKEEIQKSNRLSVSLKEAIEAMIQNEMIVLQKLIGRASQEEEERHNELSREVIEAKKLLTERAGIISAANTSRK